MREVNGEMRMTIKELIEYLKLLPLDMEVSCFEYFKWLVENKKVSEK